MKTNTFINRPILSVVISLLILLAGIIGLKSMSVEQFPDIAPPTVFVETSYPGASASVLEKTVATQLENAINGVENMIYMTSESSNNGTVFVTVYFKQGTDPDMATVNVQNRVATVTGLLPAEVTKIGVTTQKQQNSILRSITLSSPNGTYDGSFLGNYFSINLKPQILRIKGVGKVQSYSPDYALRIWLDPLKMSQYRLQPSDIQNALDNQNIEIALGDFGGQSTNTFQYTVRYKGRLNSIDKFENIIIQTSETGEQLHLKDVAQIELGKSDYNFDGDGYGVYGAIYQAAGSNALEVNNQIDQLIGELRKTLPKDVEITTFTNSNDFLQSSIKKVLKTLIEAIILVILVVYFFLQDIRATLIPTLSIFVSIIGTFAIIYMLGFTLNLLTLFALVLAIGTVVDDAIVVVEAVMANFQKGESNSYLATIKSMKGLTTVLSVSTLIFMAVFIPISFVLGTNGVFYKQFGITMAVAVGISLINSLTLSPALSALILRPYNPNTTYKANIAIKKAYNATFNAIYGRYQNAISKLIKRQWLGWSIFALTIVGTVVLIKNTNTGFVPNEDMGVVYVNMSTAEGNTIHQTKEITERVIDRLKTIPEVENYTRVIGFSFAGGTGSNNAFIPVKLKHWDQRSGDSSDINSVINKIYGMTSDITDASIVCFGDPVVPGYGMNNSIELHIQNKSGADINSLYSVTQDFVAALNQHKEIGEAFSGYKINSAQYLVDVDVALCQQKGIQPRDVLSVLSGYYGGIYASNINRYSKVYRVMVQAENKYRLNSKSLENIFISIKGEMAPISQFISLKKIYGPTMLSHFNLFPSISVNAMTAEGYSSGDAIAKIKELADEKLPKGYGYEFGGMTREESNQSNAIWIVFGISALFVYLILAGLYESFFIPLAVMFSVPFGILGSFIFAINPTVI
ncbi:efflux RND transporter permease subunit [Halosquirtibacter xylanolyticus]|uniref:efflux RND transporter permease subunit n=1 Tax=Halosquirtibacter xylanolyticus TaxID=3374599 RepID=UPI00374A2CFD|nr:efflux RND transporter permease subunit [Prolixibacteraceae bacterium]